MSTHREIDQYDIVTKTVPTLHFIGVTTAQSSSMKLFPRWMEALGRPEVVIEGIDLKLHDEPERYRQAVAQIKYDPLSLGAGVTAHKIDLLEAARDMFDSLTPPAQTCHEVSSIAKRNGLLEGHTIDPAASGLSLEAIVGKNYFARTGAQVLCLGAGGAATALSLHLINGQPASDRPKRVVVVDLAPDRLERLQRIVASLRPDITFDYVCNQDPQVNDEMMAAMPAGSLVINATGMGKDRPGSPITKAGLFPRNGIAWELNYRGELDFMHQALAQKNTRNLTVADGWGYFLHGWTAVISWVLDVPINQAMFERLADIAAGVRTNRY